MISVRLASLVLVLPVLPAFAGLAPFEGVAQLAMGEMHSCALTTAGKVKCWGGSVAGQLGVAAEPFQRETNIPDVPGLPAGIVRIAAGEFSTCAIDGAGAVTCWSASRSVWNPTFEVVSGIPEGATAVAYANWHGCALTTLGEVRCWGSGPYVRLGHSPDTPGVDRVQGLPEPAVAVAAGMYHSCVVLAGGGVACWGLNSHGEVGDGSHTLRDTASPVAGLAGRAVSVVVGHEFTCALIESGSVQCWGRNDKGQLGDGTLVGHAVPKTVQGLAGVTKIAAGPSRMCALKGDGTVWCWGVERDDLYRDARVVALLRPTQIPGELAVDVAVSRSGTCLVTPQARLRCLGSGLGTPLAVGRAALQYYMTEPMTVLERTPIIAGDTTRDRRAEMFWRDVDGGGVAWWTLDGATPTASAYFPAGPEWTLAGTGDFDGNGSTDLVWRRRGDGATYVWLLDGLSILGYRDFGTRAPPEWVLAGAPDLDGDGISDFLWRAPNGGNYHWLSVGDFANQSLFDIYFWPWSTRLLGFGDTNRDGFSEALLMDWNGTVYLVYRLSPPAATPYVLTPVAIGKLAPFTWTLAAFADFDGDGRSDLLWRAYTGEIYIWFMRSATVTWTGEVWNPGLAWSIRAVSDFDGDGKADLLWRHADGAMYLWKMNGASVSASLPLSHPGGRWQVTAP